MGRSDDPYGWEQCLLGCQPVFCLLRGAPSLRPPLHTADGVPVVTGRKIGLQASGGKRFAKQKVAVSRPRHEGASRLAGARGGGVACPGMAVHSQTTCARLSRISASLALFWIPKATAGKVRLVLPGCRATASVARIWTKSCLWVVMLTTRCMPGDVRLSDIPEPPMAEDAVERREAWLKERVRADGMIYCVRGDTVTTCFQKSAAGSVSRKRGQSGHSGSGRWRVRRENGNSIGRRRSETAKWDFRR